MASPGVHTWLDGFKSRSQRTQPKRTESAFDPAKYHVFNAKAISPSRAGSRGLGLRNAVRIGNEQGGSDPTFGRPFLVGSHQIEMMFTRSAEWRKGVCLSQPYVAIPICEGQHQRRITGRSHVKRNEGKRRFIREHWLWQASCHRENPRGQNPGAEMAHP